MSYWSHYPRYVTVAEKQAKAARKLAKLKKTNPDIRPVVIEGVLAKTWWGKSWNVNLERYADYSNRIGRGRSYVRNGSVLDLQIAPGEVKAIVQGSSTYDVTVSIAEIKPEIWENIKKACQGQFDSLPELLQGKFPKDLAEIFTEKGNGLFPSPEEIKLSCSCPDWATMCKHVAATLYGIGARLDHDPLLLFTLRNADVTELISEAMADRTKSLLEKAGKKTARVLDDTDLGDMFGIELDDAEFPVIEKKPSKKTVSAGKGKPTRKKPTAAGKKSGQAIKQRSDSTAKPKKPKQAKSVKKTAMPDNWSVDLVDELVRTNKNGVDIATLMEITGLDDDQIFRIVLKLSAQGKIVRAAKGKYKTNG